MSKVFNFVNGADAETGAVIAGDFRGNSWICENYSTFELVKTILTHFGKFLDHEEYQNFLYKGDTTCSITASSFAVIEREEVSKFLYNTKQVLTLSELLEEDFRTVYDESHYAFVNWLKPKKVKI